MRHVLRLLMVLSLTQIPMAGVERDYWDPWPGSLTLDPAIEVHYVVLYHFFRSEGLYPRGILVVSVDRLLTKHQVNAFLCAFFSNLKHPIPQKASCGVHLYFNLHSYIGPSDPSLANETNIALCGCSVSGPRCTVYYYLGRTGNQPTEPYDCNCDLDREKRGTAQEG